MSIEPPCICGDDLEEHAEDGDRPCVVPGCPCPIYTPNDLVQHDPEAEDDDEFGEPFLEDDA